MQAVIKRLSEDVALPKGAEKYIFLNVADKVHQDFGQNWLDIQSKQWDLSEF